MGEYDKQPTKQAAAATAGPSASDRLGAGPVGSNIQSRIIKADIVDEPRNLFAPHRRSAPKDQPKDAPPFDVLGAFGVKP